MTGQVRSLTMGRQTALMLAVLLSATACDTLFAPYKPPPLSGQRISILALQSRLEPDPRIQDTAVRLPRPFANVDWAQDRKSVV